MDWPQASFGYDQIYANTQLDGYDAAYTTPFGEAPHRTMKTPKNVSFREPVASYYDVSRRPYRSPDSSLLETPRAMTVAEGTSSSCGSSPDRGIPGPIGKVLDCGCGCRGGKKVDGMRSAKDKIISGDIDMNNIYMLFILMLALIVIVNAMNLKHMAKQIKVLTKAAVARSSPPGPGPP
jgi:hypothetical protein